ncbi:hypothetical protein BDA96_03G036600 [Sorghum bicolor]|uniref:Uncharacterized protein n=2 Tax=Sorghum bicolor TaxID=4558 RepID=A0A921UNM5_SORBI|nr:hypothetical protein BDA96_03G036600 [Sorghum bicolor]KXG31639.1 hypothetical protein SORBI_3003G033600 [Sorghum bicolor]
MWMGAFATQETIQPGSDGGSPTGCRWMFQGWPSPLCLDALTMEAGMEHSLLGRKEFKGCSSRRTARS